MSRVDAAAQRVVLEAEQSPHALLAFLTITHPGLDEPIRVVSDVMDYQVDGLLWSGRPFGHQLLTDGEGTARTQLVIQNVDRRIGAALRRATERAKLRLEIRSSGDFDLSVDPRVEVVANPPIYSFLDLYLINVQADALQIVGDVQGADYSVEPFPSVRATQDRFPGQFR